jgi:Fic-DOC domain mobile mystery protein B
MTPFQADQSSTPLNPDEIAGLIPSHVTMRRELNELESANILAADLWAFRRRRPQLFTEPFLLLLHRRMFGRIWRWAGAYRRTPRNLGVDSWHIPVEVRILLADVEYWVSHATFQPDECAIRFHHRLVAIHPFPNGNGRHSRLMADLIARHLNVPRFSWGAALGKSNGNLTSTGDLRKIYIQALQSADQHNHAPLIQFARS